MTERATYWTEQLAAWERSGLSQAEFCRRYGIKRVTLGWWKRQRRRSSGGTSKRRRRPVEVSKSFVELTGPVRFSAPTYEVVPAGDRAIRVRAQFDPQILSRLIVSCKLAGVDPFAWLKDVLTRMPTHPTDRVAELIPREWKKRQGPQISPATPPVA